MKKLYRISYTEKVISEITLRANTKEEALEKLEEQNADAKSSAPYQAK